MPKPKTSGARGRMDRLRCHPWVQFAGLCLPARGGSEAPWDLGKGHGKALRRLRRVQSFPQGAVPASGRRYSLAHGKDARLRPAGLRCPRAPSSER